jgi:RsiW-degrading membrane proteinase PrsW (M82 family)
MPMSFAALVPAALCAAWMVLLARRAPEGELAFVARALAGGAVAFAAGWAGYAALERNGISISWAELAAGRGGRVPLAAAIGVVEESAKLLGLAVASLGAWPPRGPRASGRARPGATISPGRRRIVLRRILGVSAVFAALECAFTLGEADAAVIVVRAAFAPVAHAALSLPLGLALGGAGRDVRWALPALAAAAVLHGASDLALATPSVGRLGYALILAAPAVALHLRTRLIWAREGRTAAV